MISNISCTKHIELLFTLFKVRKTFVQVFRDNTVFFFFSISNLPQIFISVLHIQIKNDLWHTRQISDANLLKADQNSHVP